MDIYNVINESKNSEILDNEDIDRLFSGNLDSALFSLASQKDEDISEFASLILKNRMGYQFAKKNDDIKDFKDDLNSDLKKNVDKANKTKRRFFELLDNYKSITPNKIETDVSPNAVVIRLFLKEYDTKYAFTWKAFKKVKKDYEKNNLLEGEDIYVLKSILEKSPNIQKVVDSTVFCKSAGTLSEKIINKLKERAEG